MNKTQDIKFKTNPLAKKIKKENLARSTMAQNATDNAKQVKTYKPKAKTIKLNYTDIVEALTLVIVFVLSWRFLAGM